MGKPTGFLEYARRETDSRDPAERVRDWEEFHLPLPEDQRRRPAAEGEAAENSFPYYNGEWCKMQEIPLEAGPEIAGKRM